MAFGGKFSHLQENKQPQKSLVAAISFNFNFKLMGAERKMKALITTIRL